MVEREAYWIRWMKNRIKNKKNVLILITGATGSGKSWADASICSQVDKNFDPKRQIVTDMEQLMKLINLERGDKLRSGSAIMWDECGIGLSNREWQSITNKLVNFLLQTFRHRRFILIMNAPYADFLDSSTRKLFHAEFRTMSIDYKTKCCRIKPQLIQYNSRNRKFYYKYLRVKTPRGIAPVKVWNVKAPDEKLIEVYEQIKVEFTSKLNKDIEMRLKQLKKDDLRSPLTEIQRNILHLMAKHKDVKIVSEEVGTTERTIHFHIAQARKKGFEVADFIQKPPKSPIAN